MALSIGDYKRILENGESFIFKARISFLRNMDETVSSRIEADIINGNLTVNWRNGTRRSINLTLTNIEGKYNPTQYGIWVNTKFLLELGIDKDGERIYFKQGVFVTSEPTLTSTDSSSTVSIIAMDKFSLLDGTNNGNLISTYMIPVNSNIENVIRDILSIYLDENSQFPIDAKIPKIEQIESGKELTPYTLRKEIGGTYSDVLLDLGNMLSRNIYYDTSGRLVYEKDLNDNSKGSLYHYKDKLDNGSNRNIYLGGTNAYKWRDLYNRIQVIGYTDENGVVYKATASNTNPRSRTSIQKIGDKFLSLDFPEIYTEELAMLRAEYELKRRNAMQSLITINSVPNLLLDVDKIIKITDKKLNLQDTRVLITSLNIPLTYNGIMTINAVRTEELVLDGE